MSCAAAELLLKAGVRRAREVGEAVNIAVVDTGANLLAFLRSVN